MYICIYVYIYIYIYIYIITYYILMLVAYVGDEIHISFTPYICGGMANIDTLYYNYINNIPGFLSP